jgi:hypothetical protein
MTTYNGVRLDKVVFIFTSIGAAVGDSVVRYVSILSNNPFTLCLLEDNEHHEAMLALSEVMEIPDDVKPEKLSVNDMIEHIIAATIVGGNNEQVDRFFEGVLRQCTDYRFVKDALRRYRCHVTTSVPLLAAEEWLDSLSLHESTLRHVNRKAKFIQQYWRIAHVDPSTAICRRRLMLEFMDLASCSPIMAAV